MPSVFASGRTAATTSCRSSLPDRCMIPPGNQQVINESGFWGRTASLAVGDRLTDGLTGRRVDVATGRRGDGATPGWSPRSGVTLQALCRLP
jgi:hypothetical protein